MYVKYNIYNDRFIISSDSVKFDFRSYSYGPEYLRYIPVGISLEHANDYLYKHPHEACIEITQKCNYSCPICIAESSPIDKFVMPFEIFEQILIGLPKSINRICITGGEPTLHPEINKIIESAVDYGFSVLISTNGSNPATLKNILRNKAKVIVSVSIYGPRKVHDTYVGVNGSFSNALESLNVAIEYSPCVQVYTTVTKFNLPHISKLSKKLRTIPITEHRLYIVKKFGRISTEIASIKEVKQIFPNQNTKAIQTIKSTSSPLIFVDAKGNQEVRNAN